MCSFGLGGMLSGELASRKKNLEREQRQRAEAAQRRAERERAAQDRVRKQREAHEEELRQRRVAEQAAAEAVSEAVVAPCPCCPHVCFVLEKTFATPQERLRHEEAIEANNGVWWSAQLRAVPLDENAASQKGIWRGADKARMPYKGCLLSCRTRGACRRLGWPWRMKQAARPACAEHSGNWQMEFLAFRHRTPHACMCVMLMSRRHPQVLLPPSAGAELMRQDAPKNGAQLFELASASGRTMHAGWAASACSCPRPLSAPSSFCTAGLYNPVHGACYTVNRRLSSCASGTACARAA